MVAKAREEAKELRNLNEELKTDVLEKDTHLDHLQKKNNELSALLEKAKGDAVAEFQASKQFTDLPGQELCSWVQGLQAGRY